MLKEGFWLNFRTGTYVEAVDLAEALVLPNIVTKLQIPEPQALLLRRLDWRSSRVKMVAIGMECELIRIRGHGDSVTCEGTFPLELVLGQLGVFFSTTQWVGPLTPLDIRDLKGLKRLVILYRDFVRMLEQPKEDWVGGFQELDDYANRDDLQDGIQMFQEALPKGSIAYPTGIENFNATTVAEKSPDKPKPFPQGTKAISKAPKRGKKARKK